MKDINCYIYKSMQDMLKVQVAVQLFVSPVKGFKFCLTALGFSGAFLKFSGALFDLGLQFSTSSADSPHV